MEPTSSGFPQAVAISEKLMPGATDTPTPWKQMTLSSPISFSTWKKLISSQERKTIKKEKTPSEKQGHTWGGGGIMSLHNNANGYICPGAPECSASLLILSTEEASKGAWPPYISFKEFNDITKMEIKYQTKRVFFFFFK